MHILLTTEMTPPYPVAQRLGIVTAECVFGMNLFRDFLAGMRDVFGGSSGAVQTVLRDARNVVLEDLRKEARRLGSDGVIGISLNYSELSGQGKSMLFLVATGTAVRFEQSPDELEEQTHADELSWRELEHELKRQELIEHFTVLQLNDETRDQLIEVEAWEVAPLILSRYRDLLKGIPDTKLELWESYFLNMPPEIAAETLYPAAVDDNSRIRKFALALLSKRKLFDNDRVKKLLLSEDAEVRVRALHLLKLDKAVYSPDDVDHLDATCTLLEELFPDQSRLVEEKGRLSSKKKQFWECGICGHKNEIDRVYCAKCNCDPYGFKPNKLHVREVLTYLHRKAVVLRKAFGLPSRNGEAG